MVVRGLYTRHTYVLGTILLRSPNTTGTTPFLAVGIVLLVIMFESFGMADGFCCEVGEAFLRCQRPRANEPLREDGALPVVLLVCIFRLLRNTIFTSMIGPRGSAVDR